MGPLVELPESVSASGRCRTNIWPLVRRVGQIEPQIGLFNGFWQRLMMAALFPKMNELHILNLATADIELKHETKTNAID